MEYDPWAVQQEPAPEPLVTEPAMPPTEAYHVNPAASAQTQQEVARAVEERAPLPAWRQSFANFYQTIVGMTTRSQPAETQAEWEAA
eukprot:1441606-Alexandrium_andersonii.AAC.1